VAKRRPTGLNIRRANEPWRRKSESEGSPGWEDVE
jgi:hypothetical protein